MKRNSDTQLAEGVFVDAISQESDIMARKLVELHFKAQMKVMVSESRLKNVQKDLYAVQGDMASGSHIEFYIKPDLMGLVIGKKGVRIQSVEKINGIKSVNIDGSTGKISITGPDSSTVQSAREFLELFEENFDIQPIHAEWLSKDRMNGSLTDIKTAADLMVAKVDRDKNQLIVIGTGPAVRSARTFLATQLEYINKQIGIETTMQSTREQLFSFKKQYGIDYGRGRGGEGRGGGRGRDEGRGRGGRGERSDRNERGDRGGPSALATLPQPPRGKDDHRSIPPPPPSTSSQQPPNASGSRSGNRSGRDSLQDINSLTAKVGNVTISNDVRQQDKAAASIKPTQDTNGISGDKPESSRKRQVSGNGNGKSKDHDKKTEKEGPKVTTAPPSGSSGPPKPPSNPIDEVNALIKGNQEVVKKQGDTSASLPKRVRRSKSNGKDNDTKAAPPVPSSGSSSAPSSANSALTPTPVSAPKKESNTKEDTSAKGLSLREARNKKDANKKVETEKS